MFENCLSYTNIVDRSGQDKYVLKYDNFVEIGFVTVSYRNCNWLENLI